MMIEKFLNAKHWQIFLLTFGIPFSFQIVMMVSMIANVFSNKTPDLTFMFNYMAFIPLILLLFMGIFFGWFWSVAIGLQTKLPEGLNMKVKKFKILFFTPLVYILFISVIILTSVINGGINPAFFAIIVPLHLFSMFCMFYTLYFVSKTFKTVELQRETNFSDFAGEFFMLWFFPIGIWIVQPKINKIVET